MRSRSSLTNVLKGFEDLTDGELVAMLLSLHILNFLRSRWLERLYVCWRLNRICTMPKLVFCNVLLSWNLDTFQSPSFWDVYNFKNEQTKPVWKGRRVVELCNMETGQSAHANQDAPSNPVPFACDWTIIHWIGTDGMTCECCKTGTAFSSAQPAVVQTWGATGQNVKIDNCKQSRGIVLTTRAWQNKQVLLAAANGIIGSLHPINEA